MHGSGHGKHRFVLETCVQHLELGNVLSDVFGTSGQAMLEALLENKQSAAQIAELGHSRI